MRFQTVSVVRQPIELVWPTMRDQLPLVTSRREDIHSVREEERQVAGPVHRIVNVWTANMKLPAAVMNLLGVETFTWTDRAQWDNEKHICSWAIEPHKFQESLQCHGTTVFEPAVGGRSTKVTFSGNLEWKSGKLLGLSGSLGDALLSSLEGVVRNAIQRNFRRIAEAVADHLGKAQ